MGKTPKKAAPGGDERILYVRRLKATSTLSSKGPDTNLPVRQRESDNSNRPKPIGVQRRLPVPVGKAFKSKLRSPARTKSQQALKNPTRFQPTTSKEEKKPTFMVASKSQDSEETRMYTETEESAVQLKVLVTKKDAKEGSAKSTEETHKVEEETSVSHSQSNGKESAEVDASTKTREENSKERNGEASTEAAKSEENSKMEKGETEIEFSERTKKDVGRDEVVERALTPESDESLKLVDEPEAETSTEQNGDSEQCPGNAQNEEHVEERKDAKRSESCSVDVVESTTSEISENVNPSQSDKDAETTESTKENDPSFVSYDSSIMLKDVQIKLNDCLKENSKLFDVSNVEESTSVEQPKRADVSFGKTLRNISGRPVINRLKYITVREQRFSPNSSLFVNTSSASFSHDDSMSNKMTRYPTELSDTITYNGNPADRKRKMPDTTAAATKKFKTESSSGLLNTSLEMLKNLRRPVQVSTPNAKPYKFQSDKLSPKNLSDDKLTIDAEVTEPKKWCIVM